jgi:cytochrome bd ubiquinol oxidase subunit I
LVSSLIVAITGDSSARTISKIQPVKFASFEALFNGKVNAPLTVFGILKNSGEKIGEKSTLDFVFSVKIPDLLSVMTSGDKNAYVPGLYDHVMGNTEKGIMSFAEKARRGAIALQTLLDYKKAKNDGDTDKMISLRGKFNNKDFRETYFKYFGYAFINDPEDIIPGVQNAFYSFHLMVILGFLFIITFSLILIFHYTDKLLKHKWFLRILIFSIPLPYMAGTLGWVLAETGRQPWIIQDLMPVSIAASNISIGSVQITFWIFAFIFTALLIAEISIMLKHIRTGPKPFENK